MSSLIFIDDKRVTVEGGIVKHPIGTVLGLRDQDLTPIQKETLKARTAEEKELLRQFWYVKYTLTKPEKECFIKLNEKQQVK